MTAEKLKSDFAPSVPGQSSALRQFSALPGPAGIPIFGNLLQIDSKRFHRVLERWADKYGLYYRIRIGRRQVLVVSDSAVIANLLRARPGALRRSTRIANAFNELGVNGLFTAEGEDWRMQRKLVMRALTPEVVRNFFPTLSAMTERLLRRWRTTVQEGRQVDVQRDLKAFALDVTISLAMGQDANTLEFDDNPLQRDIDLLFRCVARRITSLFPYWRYVRLAPDRAADAAAARIENSVAGFIMQARKRMQEQPHLLARPSNMLEALLAARDEPGSEFTDQHVIGNAITMVFAGEDTTSNAIAWLIYLLARHPDAGRLLKSEVDAVMETDLVLKQFSQLDAFTYLDAMTSEAMRLKPVATAQSMETNHDVQIGDVLVPQGTAVTALYRQASRMSFRFADFESFTPERWLKGGDADNEEPGAQTYPFGGGPRFCPGRYLALAEITMVMSMLARNFNIELDASAPPVDELFSFTMTPDSLPIRLSERTADDSRRGLEPAQE